MSLACVCILVEEGNACYFEYQEMFISEFVSDANFGLTSFKLLVYSTINYNDKIDRFTMASLRF